MFMTVILLLLMAPNSFQSLILTFHRDTGVETQFNSLYLIGKLNTKVETICIVECAKKDTCLSVTFNQVNGECFMYNNSVNATNMVNLPSNSVYVVKFSEFNQSCSSKKCKPNTDLFCNATKKLCECEINREWSPTQSKCLNITNAATTTVTISTTSTASTVTTTTFTTTTTSTTNTTATATTTSICLSGFFWDGFNCVLVSNVFKFFNGSSPNIIEVSNFSTNTLIPIQFTFIRNGVRSLTLMANFVSGHLVAFDENMNYLYSKAISGAIGIVAVEGDVYACSFLTDTVFKMDKNFIISSNISSCDVTPCLTSLKGLAYDSITNHVYLSGDGMVYVLDRDLVLFDTITINAGYTITAMQIYNGKLYLGAYNEVLVIQNKTVIATHSNVCTQLASTTNSFYFDNYGYLLVSCLGDEKIHMCKEDFTSCNSDISVESSLYIDVDPIGRLFVSSVTRGVIIFS